MPVTLSYPGVYIEEVPPSVRTITGVSTSITAFIGRALRGPVNEAKTIHSFTDYSRIFGSLWKESNMSYAVYHYFLNGGMDAIIVRVFKQKGGGDDGIAKFEKGGTTLKLKASWNGRNNPGSWGKNLKIRINHDVDKDKEKEDNTIFNLIVDEVEDTNIVLRESFLNISTTSDSPRFITRVLEEESTLVQVDGDVPTGKPPEGDFELIENSANDGDPLDVNEVKTGISPALDKVDLFNLLCIPPYADEEKVVGGSLIFQPKDVYTSALSYCEKRRAMFIVDPPKKWKDKELPKQGIEDTNFVPERKSNTAIFFPRIKAADPEEEGRVREFVPSGAICGIIARTDSQRGVWKAPAGIEATVAGATDLTVRLTDEENGELNPLGINCLRILPAAGIVVWGSRTMRGADRLTDQWKYLPVRRTALYIEESLYRGTQFAVFEPNDEPLWSQIRLSIGAFMQDLFRKGAFQGKTSKEAYFVKCDSETTTQFDIDRGIVNIIVGFAPLKPAEFVVLKIQQKAGPEAE